MNTNDKSRSAFCRSFVAPGAAAVAVLAATFLLVQGCGHAGALASAPRGDVEEPVAPEAPRQFRETRKPGREARPQREQERALAPEYANMTDRANGDAAYVGTAACIACHEDVGEVHAISGHSYKLQRVEGSGPTYPSEAPWAGIPHPPAGVEWKDVAYVIGGYTRKGRFIDADGYVLTNDANGVDPQWNLAFPPNGTPAGFVPYENKGKFGPDHPKPYNYSCFRCHTTGARAQDPDDPRFEESRPGFAGSFEEPGVQCEACHGPGSNHVASRRGRDIYVGLGAADCGECHTRGDDPHVVMAKGGYIRHHEQWPELLASGGHADLGCTDCHEPHASTNFERDDAMVMECSDCHRGHSMAGHAGLTFRRNDYAEALTCESCHMAFATKSAAAATRSVVGPYGRMGDTRTHIFRIDTRAVDYTRMFTEDGGQVRRADDGTAAVTVDFACLRCHNEAGNASEMSLAAAAAAARGMHLETSAAASPDVRGE